MKSPLRGKIGVISGINSVKSLVSRRLQENGLSPMFLDPGDGMFSSLQNHSEIGTLLLDVDDLLPEQNELLSRLHHEYPLLKVVILSSDCTPQQVRRAMHNGVFDFVPKPLDVRDLDNAILRAESAAKELQKNVNDYEELLAIEHELDVARNIQGSIIPKNDSISSATTYQISGRNLAAQIVGGDFFDYFALEKNRLGFVIGDVASKGIPAAIFMAVSRTLFKTIAMKGMDPATSLAELNRVLVLESDPSMFIAVFYGILDTGSGEIVYANGGHTHPVLVRSDGSMKILDHSAEMVLGVVGDVEYQVHGEKMQPGDIFFMVTDGLGLLADMHGKPVSDHFVKRNLIKYRRQSPDYILDRIYKSVAQIHPDTQSLNDDITCLILKYLNGG